MKTKMPDPKSAARDGKEQSGRVGKEALARKEPANANYKKFEPLPLVKFESTEDFKKGCA